MIEVIGNMFEQLNAYGRDARATKGAPLALGPTSGAGAGHEAGAAKCLSNKEMRRSVAGPAWARGPGVRAIYIKAAIASCYA